MTRRYARPTRCIVVGKVTRSFHFSSNMRDLLRMRHSAEQLDRGPTWRTKRNMFPAEACYRKVGLR